MARTSNIRRIGYGWTAKCHLTEYDSYVGMLIGNPGRWTAVLKKGRMLEMKKLGLLLCLALTLGLFAGCQTGNADPTQTTARQEIRPLPPENPGSSLCEYDPDRRIYIGTENIYMDYYFGITGAPYLDIPVYSKFSLGNDPQGGLGHILVDLCWSPDMELSLDQCWTEITLVEVQRKTEFMAGKIDSPENVMPYYVYQAYRGGDVAALANAKIGYQPDSNRIDTLRTDFEALTAEELPEFYVYNFRIHFSDVPEPEPENPLILEKIKFTAEGQTYEGEFGSVRFFNREDCPNPKKVYAEPVYADAYTGIVSELYSDGIVKVLRIPVIHKLDLEKEYTADCNPAPDTKYASIGGVWMLDEGSELLAAYVTIKDQYGEYQTFAVNDLENRRSVEPGESAYVDVVVKNAYAEKLLSNIHFQIVVWWVHDAIQETPIGSFLTGHNHCDVYTVVSTTKTNHYENYAIIFDGVDMEPYYDYYHENYQMWRKDYLN